MSTATAHLLSEFDRLSPEEQREFSAILLRRTAQIDDGDITDEELTASAARVFEILDAEEGWQSEVRFGSSISGWLRRCGRQSC
jgi:hypothetical protein